MDIDHEVEKAKKLIEDFLDLSTTTYHSQLRKRSPSAQLFTMLRRTVEKLPDDTFVYDNNTNKLYLKAERRQIERAINLAREIDTRDHPKALTFSDLKGELPPQYSNHRFRSVPVF